MERTEFIKDLISKEFLVEEWVDFSTAFAEVEQILKAIVYEKVASHPAGEKIFRALNECKPDDLKVVILGQDPFYDGSAVGLSFDNKNDGSKLSPSLKTILAELDQDVPVDKQPLLDIPVADSYLGHLPAQGVLLLNTALTVQHGKPGSHTRLWKPFTEQLIKDIQKKDDIIWILWGNHSKAYKKSITNETHHIIEGGHPSPLNTSVPFAGGKYFSRTNALLRGLGKETINW